MKKQRAKAGQDDNHGDRNRPHLISYPILSYRLTSGASVHTRIMLVQS